MRAGYLRGSISRPATQRQMEVLAAFVAAGGSVQDAPSSWASGRALSSVTSPTCVRDRGSPPSSSSTRDGRLEGSASRAWSPV